MSCFWFLGGAGLLGYCSVASSIRHFNWFGRVKFNDGEVHFQQFLPYVLSAQVHHLVIKQCILAIKHIPTELALE
jgi:hypothetical protein